MARVRGSALPLIDPALIVDSACVEITDMASVPKKTYRGTVAQLRTALSIPESGTTDVLGTSGNPWADVQSKTATIAGQLTLASGIITTSVPVINASQTWNAAGNTFTGMLLNVVDTASQAASALFDLQLASVSKFKVTKDGSFAGTALALTGGIVTTAVPVFSATQTWNAGGVTFTGALLNVTDTASAAASLLFDLQVGGVSKVSARKDGVLAAIGLTLVGGTVTSSAPALTLTQTWNAGGVTFTGAVLNVTDTASANASLLADWQVGGVSKVAVRKDGALILGMAATSIIPGATSVSLRNNADNADNFILTDAGQGTLRGDLIFATIAKGISLKTGANGRSGSFTLIGGSKTFNNSSITANTHAVFTLTTVSGVSIPGPIFITGRSAGVSMSVQSAAGASDTSTFEYFLYEVA